MNWITESISLSQMVGKPGYSDYFPKCKLCYYHHILTQTQGSLHSPA